MSEMPELNLNDLCQEIGKLCKNFNDEWTAKTNTQALSFMKLVLYEISPKSHAIKKNKEEDKRWMMRFGERGEGREDGIVHIATFFRSPPPTWIQPRIHNGNELLLTVEQAVLLATVCMEKFVPIGIELNPNILPPMAAAVFCQNDILEIAKELNISAEKVTLAVISSAIRSGFHLTHSSCAVAVVYAFYATEDTSKREYIKAKIIENYARKGKHYNEEEFTVYHKHCYGIVANDWVSFMFAHEALRNARP